MAFSIKLFYLFDLIIYQYSIIFIQFDSKNMNFRFIYHFFNKFDLDIIQFINYNNTKKIIKFKKYNLIIFIGIFIK